MGAMASKITSLTIVYSTVYSDTDQRKHQSSASLAFVWGIHRILAPVISHLQASRRSITLEDLKTGDQWIPAQMTSNSENVFISWRHHVSKHRDSWRADGTLHALPVLLFFGKMIMIFAVPPGAGVTNTILLASRLPISNFLTWLLIGWQHRRRSLVGKCQPPPRGFLHRDIS